MSATLVNGTRELTFIQAIQEAMFEEMERDPSVFVIGEDVGKLGGAFGATAGLQEKFGPKRVIDAPIEESGFVGVGVGAAAMGKRPIVEMQFMDFISCGFDQIVNVAATFRYRSGGQVNVPMVIRGPSGAHGGGALFHSQQNEAWFAHVPGLKVVLPYTAYDAKGLLKAAIRDNNPVLFFEHKWLYRRIKGQIPAEDYIVPLGKAAIRRPGKHLSIITYSKQVHDSLEAAEILMQEGIDVEVIDLRTLKPLDKETILESVKKTNRVLVVHEACRTGGFGGEIAAIIADEGFEYLDAPVTRLTRGDVFVPFGEEMEKLIVPGVEDIAAAARKLASY